MAAILETSWLHFLGPKTRWQETTEVYPPQVMRPEVRNQDVSRTGSFWRL